MNINDLFCTPEQGRRLKALVPELTSVMEWIKVDEDDSFGDYPYFRGEWDDIGVAENPPAITLQELRDMIWDINQEYQETHKKEIFDFYDFESNCKYSTAPEFADWVIERLEGGDDIEMKVGDSTQIKVWGEECCEVCNEIVWNWISKCPVCNGDNVLVEEHGDLYYEDNVQCSNCKSIFRKISGSWYSGYNCQVEVISMENNK